MLNNYPEEETLMSIEADLGAEKAKLKFIPKVLEENFIVDSKYILTTRLTKLHGCIILPKTIPLTIPG